MDILPNGDDISHKAEKARLKKQIEILEERLAILDRELGTYYSKHLEKLDQMKPSNDDYWGHRMIPPNNHLSSKGTLPKGFKKKSAETKPVERSVTGRLKMKHLIGIGIGILISLGVIVAPGTPANNESSNIIDMSSPPATLIAIPLEIQSDALNDRGQCATSDSCKTARAQIIAMTDCDEMIDLWTKSPDWILRPIIASQIVERC